MLKRLTIGLFALGLLISIGGSRPASAAVYSQSCRWVDDSIHFLWFDIERGFWACSYTLVG